MICCLQSQWCQFTCMQVKKKHTMLLHTFKVCVDVSTCANNGQFFGVLFVHEVFSPPRIGWIFFEGSTSCNMKKAEGHGAVGAAWFLRSHNKNACVEKIICPCDRTQLSFFYDRISNLIINVHLLTYECMGEVWRAQEKRNRWLYCVFLILGAPRHVFRYKTVWKEC